jgi:hypothetical protein
MITADLVYRRIANFWGYGSFEAPAWFVGMEEGLGPETELEERFRASDGKATIDIRRDMARIPHAMRWFQPPRPPIQPNWKYPLALYLFLRNGRPSTPEEIRAYQLDVLGDVDRKDSCVIELMPLPARSSSDEDWRYSNYVGSRRQYLERYKPERVRQLRTLIGANRPRLVIFHSLKYLSDWASVLGSGLQQITRQMHFAAANGSASCVIPNANSRGMSYDRLYEFAERVRPQVSLTNELAR